MLHYLIPTHLIKCEICSQLNQPLKPIIIIPIVPPTKYKIKLACGHKITTAMKLAIKKYYSYRLHSARAHVRKCLAELADKGGLVHC